MSTGIRSLGEAGTRPATEPRASRTLHTMTDALLRLLEREELTGISVSQLCREAGVHRTTFYGHYSSVTELATDIFVRVIDGIATIEFFEPDEEVTPGAASAEYLASLEHILAHVADHRAVYRSLFHADLGSGFRHALTDRLRHRVEIAMRLWQRHGIADNLDVQTAAAYIAGCLVAAIESWTSSTKVDSSAHAHEIMLLMPAWWPAATATRA
ncbi:MAG: TetR/AcrR family transcriptional regulator [Microbacteriaceae bacterium]